ncbi:MAG: GTPase Era [Turicibacter sp.]|nr:GTPase Era [Turicibacter sp.]
MQHKSGFVSLAGRPNVGKSTLMNQIIGEKIAIVSNRPQTTRNKIRSIFTETDCQIIFIDTPGLHEPKTKLGDFMVKSAQNSFVGVDIVLYLVEPTVKIHEFDLQMLEKLGKFTDADTKTMLIINKVDKISKPDILLIIEAYSKYNFSEIVPISAIKGENTDKMLAAIKSHLPLGPQYFPDDTITDQPERQIAAELIREKALLYLQEEIPHGIAVEIEKFKKRKKSELVDIGAVVYCERESHKPIVIGKAGVMLKKIGQAARADIERLLGSPINLQLWVKVRKNWRDNDLILRGLGYDAREL